jgi:hypothetical protein
VSCSRPRRYNVYIKKGMGKFSSGNEGDVCRSIRSDDPPVSRKTVAGKQCSFPFSICTGECIGPGSKSGPAILFDDCTTVGDVQNRTPNPPKPQFTPASPPSSWTIALLCAMSKIVRQIHPNLNLPLQGRCMTHCSLLTCYFGRCQGALMNPDHISCPLSSNLDA